MSFAHTEDGTRIQYETHGSGKMKVILLHGWGGSASYWRELVRHLNLEGTDHCAELSRARRFGTTRNGLHARSIRKGYALSRR
jgi:pimeloyl-ACP methyl ester carboxylesterase